MDKFLTLFKLSGQKSEKFGKNHNNGKIEKYTIIVHNITFSFTFKFPPGKPEGTVLIIIHFLNCAEKSVHFPSDPVEFFKELANLRPVENEFFIGWIFFLRMV